MSYRNPAKQSEPGPTLGDYIEAAKAAPAAPDPYRRSFSYVAELEGMAYASVQGGHSGHAALLLTIHGCAAFPLALPDGFGQAKGLRIGSRVRVTIEQVDE